MRVFAGQRRDKEKFVSKTDLADLFKRTRKTRGLTQEQLEEMTGLGQSIISRLEKTGEGLEENRLILAKALGIPATTMWRVLGGEVGVPEMEYGPEVLNLAQRIKDLSPRARLHIEAQLEMLEMISDVLAASHITEAEVRQAQAIIDKYRRELEEESKKKEQPHDLN